MGLRQRGEWARWWRRAFSSTVGRGPAGPPLRPRHRTRRPAAVAVAALLAWFGLHTLATSWAGLRDSVVPADLAVVLGTRVDEDGRPSRRLRARLERALELHREGQVDEILVSGGPAPGGQEEAEVMRDYLVARGVPADRVVTDPTGVDTWATARAVADLVERRGPLRVLVVSQFFHLPRAELALARQGVPAVGAAHARHADPRDLYSLAREFFAFYYYLVRPE